MAGSGVNPPQGETVTVTINSNQISATIVDAGGNFSLSFPSASLSVNGSPYAINFAYVGDGNLAATNDSSTSLTVNPASATVSLSDLNQVYNGYAESVTANTVPTNLLVVISYNGSSSAPTNAGSYTVVGTITDPNYQGSVTNTLLVDQAAGIVNFYNLIQICDGTGKAVSYTTTPSNLTATVTYNGSSDLPTNVGSYTVVAVINDPNYTGSATNIFAINSAIATNSPNVVASLIVNELTLAWPADHIGWRLQSQTNGLSISNWFDVPGSDATNKVSIPINVTQPAVFYRLCRPAGN